jgi:hypothetical protein
LAIGASALVLARAQRPDAAALKAIAGHEKKAHEQTTIVSPPLSKAESDAIVGKIQAIRKLLIDTPALQGLRGYDWATFGHVTGQGAGQPLRARLGYIAYPYFFNARLNRAESSAEGAPFTIYLNDPDALLGQGGYRVDADAKFTFAPKDTGLVDGFPAYIDGEQFVVLMKDARPLFVPVTEQQFLDVRIAEERKSFADLDASLAAMSDGASKRDALSRGKARLTNLEAELAALPAERRAAPALDPDGTPTKRASFLAEPGAARTRAIVTPNPQLFESKQPRTAVQLIVLGSIRYQPELFRAVQQQIDKAALVKLLE